MVRRLCSMFRKRIRHTRPVNEAKGTIDDDSEETREASRKGTRQQEIHGGQKNGCRCKALASEESPAEKEVGLFVLNSMLFRDAGLHG